MLKAVAIMFLSKLLKYMFMELNSSWLTTLIILILEPGSRKSNLANNNNSEIFAWHDSRQSRTLLQNDLLLVPAMLWHVIAIFYVELSRYKYLLIAAQKTDKSKWDLQLNIVCSELPTCWHDELSSHCQPPAARLHVYRSLDGRGEGVLLFFEWVWHFTRNK